MNEEEARKNVDRKESIYNALLIVCVIIAIVLSYMTASSETILWFLAAVVFWFVCIIVVLGLVGTIAFSLSAFLSAHLKEKTPLVIYIAGLLIAIIVFIECKDRPYISQYEKGFEAGRQEGYEAGHEDGYSEGYDEGYEVGDMEGYDAGYEDGYSDGN